MATQHLPATLQRLPNAEQVSCQGEWTLAGITKLNIDTEALCKSQQALVVDGSGITAMDSSGAWELHQFLEKLSSKQIKVTQQGFSQEQQTLLALIKEQAEKISPQKPLKPQSWLEQVGRRAVTMLNETQIFLDFIGRVAVTAKQVLLRPKQLRWQMIASIIEIMGYQALPIIALLSFMIGVVLTYQMGVQLRSYGANIFIVDLLGVSVFREFAPLLTAIMVAGRTGSAFTAQLGTMKLNQEIDALSTMGIAPNEFLILPRILGLFIALPLLTVWADIFGILGGMIMAKSMLDLSIYDFLQRFANVVPVKSLLIGVGKAPIFALLIASIGCFQGMQVLNSADSVGRQTTKSVVQAIFFIIVADAIFSVLFSKFQI